MAKSKTKKRKPAQQSAAKNKAAAGKGAAKTAKTGAGSKPAARTTRASSSTKPAAQTSRASSSTKPAAQTFKASSSTKPAAPPTRTSSSSKPSGSSTHGKRHRKTRGFAWTKRQPHKEHPAHYKKKGDDEVEYITFTHSEEVELPDGETVTTIPLKSNINPKERGDRKSYVYPKRYRSKRSALGKEDNTFSLTPEDKKIVDELMKILPVEEVKNSSNSKRKKPQT